MPKEKPKSPVLKEILHKNKLKNGKSCVYCNCNLSLFLTIDHATPKVRGGEDTDKNKQVTCFNCNFLKGSLTHVEFKKYLKALVALKELAKVKAISHPKIYFNEGHYPDFKHPPRPQPKQTDDPKQTVVKK